MYLLMVALDFPFDMVGNCLWNTTEINNSNGIRNLMNYTAENEHIVLTDNSKNIHVAMAYCSASPESIERNSMLTTNIAFRVHFFWLCHHLSLFSDCKTKAFNEFCTCLSLLGSGKKSIEIPNVVILPHCKFVRVISIDRVLHQINLLN